MEIPLRPTRAEIDLGNLEFNYGSLCEVVAPARVLCAVKANAYGHGLVECAARLERAGVPFLGVAILEEGVELRKAGIRTPILVMGGIAGSQIRLFLEYDLDMTASSIAKLEAIDHTAKSLGKKARIHLKIDTGMERIGVHYYNVEPFLRRAVECKHCEIVGVFSHFSTIKEGDLSFGRLQLERFLEAVSFFEKHSLPRPIRHIAASAGILAFPESHLDMVRAGVALYGSLPSSKVTASAPLKPVMRLRSEVVYFKVVKKGAGVSYGRTWIAPKDTRVVTVPIGYADGYIRELSNRGVVLINGKRYPVVGVVCMDQIMVDIGDGEAYNGDEVIVLGSQGQEEITVSMLAELGQTIPHVITTSISARVPRQYVSSGG